MSLISIDTIKSFNELNKQLWKYCWKYWYAKEYAHFGIKEYLNNEIAKIKKEKYTKYKNLITVLMILTE